MLAARLQAYGDAGQFRLEDVSDLAAGVSASPLGDGRAPAGDAVDIEAAPTAPSFAFPVSAAAPVTRTFAPGELPDTHPALAVGAVAKIVAIH